MYRRKAFSVLWPVIFIIERVGIPARYIFVAKLLRAVEDGAISVFWSTEIMENRMGEVLTRGPALAELPLPNDHLFVFAGGDLPTPFLERCGIQIDTKFGVR